MIRRAVISKNKAISVIQWKVLSGSLLFNDLNGMLEKNLLLGNLLQQIEKQIDSQFPQHTAQDYRLPFIVILATLGCIDSIFNVAVEFL